MIIDNWENISKPTSSIRTFNTEVTTEPFKRGRYSAQLAEASYAEKTFVHQNTSVGLSEIT